MFAGNALRVRNLPPCRLCWRLADHYNSDLIVSATEKSPGFLPARHSFFALEDSSGNVKVPAMKRSESGDALICRGVNLSEQATRLTISPAWDAARVELANLLETPVNAVHRAPVPQSQKDLWIKPNLYPEAFHASICSVISGTTGAPACILEENEESEDFSRFPCTDYITEDDIENENARAEMFKDRLDDPLYRRSALEARLSAILLKHRRDSYPRTWIRTQRGPCPAAAPRLPGMKWSI